MNLIGTRPRNRQALALIVVVYVLAALGTLAFALAFRSRIAVYEAQLLIDGTQQDAAAWAACTQACRLLALDEPEVDSYDDAWAGLHTLESPQNMGGTVQCRVEWLLADESARINVNEAPSDVLSRIEGLDAAVVASILDWIDADDVPNPDGAENDYYAGLAPGYACRNAPLENIEELTLIKGITAALYFGVRPPGALGERSDPGRTQSYATEQEGGVNLGLVELLTVYGDGRINLNTASEAVLRTIPFLSEPAIGEILARQQPRAGKFTAPADIEAAEAFSAADKIVLSQTARFNSSHFLLRIQVRLGGVSDVGEYTAILERAEGAVRILKWQRMLPQTQDEDWQGAGDLAPAAESRG